MKTQKTKSDRMKKEEQEILDKLIDKLDSLMMQKDTQLTREELERRKAISKMKSGLPEAYGDLVTANLDYQEKLEDRRRIGQSRDELYSSRLILRQQDEERDLDQDIDIKVGLHNYNYGPDDPVILGWFMPLCRHFLLDNASKTFEWESGGVHTEYTLEMRRKVDIVFDKVRKVAELYSIFGDQNEKVVADEFLQELLSRRNETEFRNIVFSIQKKQGEIIEAPFNQNMIIQGCAGSGKSMIMLHRLPIVLFDNKDTISRSSLYVITPSETYIQMARNMMADLEISDIPMGTIENYFDCVLKKYGIDPHDEHGENFYGEMKSYLSLPEEQERYVYSDQCVSDIRNSMQEMIDTAREQDFFSPRLEGILSSDDVKKAVAPYNKIQKILLNISSYNNRDAYDSRQIVQNLRNALQTIERVQKQLAHRKQDLQNTISYMLKRGKEDLRQKLEQSESEEMQAPEKAEKLRWLKEDIAKQEQWIQWDKDALSHLDFTDIYFKQLKDIAERITRATTKYQYLRLGIDRMDRTKMLKLISNRGDLSKFCLETAEELNNIEDPYVKSPVSIYLIADRLRQAASEIGNPQSELLTDVELGELDEAAKFFKDLSATMVHAVYQQIMGRLEQSQNKNGKMTALSCSPYLYTQILYQFRGAPNATRESLITIDEAQTLTPVELKLILAVNQNRVILNLFGDVHQHIEGTKGVDHWVELNSDSRFQVRFLNENYRNASQITQYCNKTFGLDMEAINTPGEGVHEIHGFESMKKELGSLFSRPLGNGGGYSCIIVKDREEARSLLLYEKEYSHRINDMTDKLVDLDIRKWNLMTGGQAKGLEFSTVFAISSRMSRNEKYIAYTRAMNELYVYCDELPLAERIPEKASFVDYEAVNKQGDMAPDYISGRQTRRRKFPSAHSQGVKEFLEANGIKVVDDRLHGGYLWAIGSKEIIRPLIARASEKFGEIGGKYGVYKVDGKTQEGWYSKTKK